MQDTWRLSAIRITKYDPKNRDDNGVYKIHEWTSYTDIGKRFNNLVFEESEYLKIEESYIDALRLILKELNCNDLCISSVEKYSSLDRFKEYNDKHLYDLYKNIGDGKIEVDDEFNDLIRLILREYLWCELENLKKGITIRFGDDYYMYVNTERDIKDALDKVKAMGIFID